MSAVRTRVVAKGMVLTGDPDNALHLIDEQIAQVELLGWEERHHYAGVLRLPEPFPSHPQTNPTH
jgi:hypothetical protein